MELQNQIKKYRAALNLSQEGLAEKIYVTRQTISNWENGKSYPDIHSLLLLSSLFDISLDQLIKGDIERMKKEIKATDIAKFNRDGAIYAILLLASILMIAPLTIFWGIPGFILWLTLYAITLFWAIRLEKFKKENNIHTYKEIVAFSEGRQLDEIQKQREDGKRPYQFVLAGLLSAIAACAIGLLFTWLIKTLL